MNEGRKRVPKAQGVGFQRGWRAAGRKAAMRGGAPAPESLGSAEMGKRMASGQGAPGRCVLGTAQAQKAQDLGEAHRTREPTEHCAAQEGMKRSRQGDVP